MFFFIKFPPQINSYYNKQISLITNLIKQVHTYKFTDIKTKKIKLNYFILFNQFIFHNFAENKPQTMVYTN